MKIGVVFPQTEIGADAGAVRAYGERAEQLGFHHLVAFDHVLGADPAVHQDWSGPYDVTTTFHEPLVLFGYLAAITRLELVTGILILPQRQTALVAKQAAEVDLLTGGRLRLGVGIGWNTVEYEALGKDFTSRGRRTDEQVQLLRRLWTEQSVTFHGADEHVTGAGLSPLPVQRPIPVWFGASATAGLPRPGPDQTSTPPAPSSRRRRSPRAATQPPLAWRAGCSGPPTPGNSSRQPTAGGRPGPPTCPSTPWVPVWPPSTSTSSPSNRSPRCSPSRPVDDPMSVVAPFVPVIS